MKTLPPLPVLLFCAAIPSAFGQAGTPASAGKTDEMIELSPFVVSHSSDVGHAITETTTGTLISRPMALLPMGRDTFRVDCTVGRAGIISCSPRRSDIAP